MIDALVYELIGLKLVELLKILADFSKVKLRKGYGVAEMLPEISNLSTFSNLSNSGCT